MSNLNVSDFPEIARELADNNDDGGEIPLALRFAADEIDRMTLALKNATDAKLKADSDLAEARVAAWWCWRKIHPADQKTAESWYPWLKEVDDEQRHNLCDV